MMYGDQNVSRETQEKLTAYEDLVKKWNPKVNLVSKGSLNDLRERHILDSFQVYDLAKSKGHWVDLGSGGGFPGLVVAILNDQERMYKVTLVESDQRKCAFLRTVIRELGVAAEVRNERIELLNPLEADILSARALADLPSLLEYSKRHLKPTGTAIFPKGASWRTEVAEAQDHWSYHCEAITSETNPNAAVLLIKDIVRV